MNTPVKMNSGAGGKILGSRVGSVGMLVINNPERHNAISLDMWQSATEVVDQLAQDDQVRLLLVSGNGGKAFASGADISKFDVERSTIDQVQNYQAVSAGFYEQLAAFPKPTIAKINGYCIGGGLALATCCDVRVCEHTARFGLPAAKLGLGYGVAAQKRLADLVGASAAADILFSARQISAQEAYEMGLVNRIVQASEFDSYVDEYTAHISENAPMTIALVKAVQIAIGSGTLEEDQEKLNEMVQSCYSSDDYKEGRQAFKEKRKPKFEGR